MLQREPQDKIWMQSLEVGDDVIIVLRAEYPPYRVKKREVGEVIHRSAKRLTVAGESGWGCFNVLTCYTGKSGIDIKQLQTGVTP